MDAESLILSGINIVLYCLTNATLTRGIANLFAAIKTLLLTLELWKSNPFQTSLMSTKATAKLSLLYLEHIVI